MKGLRRFLSRWTWWTAASARGQTLLQAEIDEHIARQTADNVRAGLSPVEARRQALLKFGGVAALKEAYRDQREPAVWRAVKSIWRDLAYAARSLSRARTFTSVCVVSLGVGMAPVIAIPYASRLLTMIPPFITPEQLIEVDTTGRGPRPATSSWSYPDFVDLRDANTGAALFAWTGAQTDVTLPASGTTARTTTLYVSANYFTTIGVPLARGPGFDDAMDDPLRAEPVVIVGYQFWQNRLDSDPAMVGQTLTINGMPHLIVGIAPDRFQGHVGFQGISLFLPLERHPLLAGEHNARSDRAKKWIEIHGRLSPGVSLGQASAAIAAVTAQLSKRYPATNEFTAGTAAAYDPRGALTRSQVRRVETSAFTLTGMVLLVVSLNIAGMMQVRSAMRERELSIRQAIGATRRQLAQLLLAEAVLLACIGGACASIVLFNLPPLLLWFIGQPFPIEAQQALSVDASMIVFCVGLCLATSLVFGFLPASRFSRPVIISSLKDDAGAGGLRVGRVHRVTAALQMAIAVPLLVMGGISLDRVRATAMNALGFDAELLYAAPLKLDATSPQQAAFQIRTVSDALSKASGVAAVAVADGLPLDFRGRRKRVALHPEANVAPRWTLAQVTRVGDGYLTTLGIPLLRGRAFTAGDTEGAERVAIISKTLAERLFAERPAAEAIGARLTFAVTREDDAATQTLTVVGVADDFPAGQMTSDRQHLLLPLAQQAEVVPDPVPDDDVQILPRVLVIARAAPGASSMAVIGAVENVARGLDPDFQRTGVITGARLRENSVNDFLTQSMVAGLAGGVILLVSAIGIYGVVGLMVATRTREIAVRGALGATRRRILGLIIVDVVKIVTPGVGIGLVLTAVVIRLNGENMGIPLSGVENLAYLVGGAIAVLVAVAASLAPARRAASVPAMVAMRSL